MNTPRLSRQRGFTLIELIVVVGIISLVSGGGIATFLNLRDRRSSLADARVVEQKLREAQRKALAGDKPSECGDNPLSGYRVRIAEDAVFLRANCPGSSAIEQETNMSVSTLVSTRVEINFKALRGGADPTTVKVCGSSGNNHYEIVVGASGSIDAPEEIEGPC